MALVVIQHQSENKKTHVAVFAELRNSDSAASEQVFNDLKREIAPLDVNHPRWPSHLLTEHYEIRIGSDDDILVRLRPFPDGPVVCLPQANVPHVG